jgi:hypothetical protein
MNNRFEFIHLQNYKIFIINIFDSVNLENCVNYVKVYFGV